MSALVNGGSERHGRAVTVARRAFPSNALLAYATCQRLLAYYWSGCGSP